MAQFEIVFDDLTEDAAAVPTGFSVDLVNFDSDIATLLANQSDCTPSYHGWGIQGGELIRTQVQLVASPAVLTQGNIDNVIYWALEWDTPGSISGDFELVLRGWWRFQGGFFFGDEEPLYFGRNFSNIDRSVIMNVGGVSTITLNPSTLAYDNIDADFAYDIENNEVLIRFKVLNSGADYEITIWRLGEDEPSTPTQTGTLSGSPTGKIGLWCIGNQTAGFWKALALGTGADAPDWPLSDYGSPGTPTISAGTPDVNGTVALTSSAFSADITSGGSHVASSWQVTLSTDTGYANPLMNIRSLEDLVDIEAYSLPVGSYIARVKHHDEWEHESAWSANVAFSISSVTAPTVLDNLDGVPFRAHSIQGYAPESVTMYGEQPTNFSASGGAGSGAVVLADFYDPTIGRYAGRIRSQSGFFEYGSPFGEPGRFGIGGQWFGPELKHLHENYPVLDVKVTVQDRVKVNTNSGDVAPAAIALWGIHMSGASDTVQDKQVNAFIGFWAILQSGSWGNWQAVITAADGTIIQEEDTGLSPTAFRRLQVAIDFLNRNIEWVIDDTQVDTASAPLDAVADWENGNWDYAGLFHGLIVSSPADASASMSCYSQATKKIYVTRPLEEV